MSDEAQPVVRDPRIGQHSKLLDWLASVDRILGSSIEDGTVGSGASPGPSAPQDDPDA